MSEVARFEFSYTTIDGDSANTFTLAGISEDVAAGIQFGLEQVPTITDVTAVTVTDQKTDVDPPAWYTDKQT
jgi:hypothetical protein